MLVATSRAKQFAIAATTTVPCSLKEAIIVKYKESLEPNKTGHDVVGDPDARRVGRA
jgi:hypothetical protein